MSSFKEIAQLLVESAEILDSFLDEHDHPMPSDQSGSPQCFPAESAPTAVNQAREKLIEGAAKLSRLSLWPQDAGRARLHEIVTWTACLPALIQNNVFSQIPTDHNASIGVQELARRCKLQDSQDSLSRAIYRLALDGILDITPDGQVSHTAISLNFTSTGGLWNEAQWFMGTLLDSSTAMPEFMKSSIGSDGAEYRTPFNMVHRTPAHVMQWIEQDPRMAAMFSGVMETYSKNPAFSLDHVIASYDWESLGTSCVVDVGGNRGWTSAAIASKFSKLRFIVQDQPAVLNGAESDLPPGVRGRITFEAHDFFELNPHAPEVFLLRFILHDWPDKEAIEIIRAVSARMREDTVLLVMDSVRNEDETSLNAKRQQADLDMIMLTAFGGKERRRAEWDDLFHKRTQI